MKAIMAWIGSLNNVAATDFPARRDRIATLMQARENMNLPSSPTHSANTQNVLPRLAAGDGALEAIKWLALVLMTGDHVNKYLFNGTREWLFDCGRIAMPLFVFVLAYNLARPGAIVRGAYHRTVWRLLVIGCLTMPVFVALGSLVAGWWPLNIMFTLAAVAGMLLLLERRTVAGQVCATGMFLAAGAMVEFWWPALALGLAVWLYCRRPSWVAIGLAAAALAGLWYVNGNLWALVAVPIVLGASGADLNVPRLRWVFYSYYPAHLVVLWLIRIPMSKAGYLFF
jgi:hypothetical protein